MSGGAGCPDRFVTGFRRRSWRFRPLPDFLIIGAQKAGTTSLYRYIVQHPAIRAAATKEVHYFDGGLSGDGAAYAKGPAWYRAHFPLALPGQRRWLTGEASPLYLFHPAAPARIREAVPDVRMIVLLRDPVTRAISHYHHEVRKGREPLDLMAALRAEETRMKGLLRERRFDHPAFIHYSYKARGLYVNQLDRYLRSFARHQLLILRSEDLFRSPQAVLPQVLRFLNMPPDWQPPDLSVANPGSGAPPSPEVLAYLQDWFTGPNEQLKRRFGISGWW